MTEQIVSRDMIRNRARLAYFAGKSRDSHGMHPWTEAAKTFVLAWDAIASSTLSVQNTAALAMRLDEYQAAVV